MTSFDSANQWRDFGTTRPSMLYWAEKICVTLTVFFGPLNHFRFEAFYFTASDFLAIISICLMIANRTINIRFFQLSTTLWLVSVGLFISGIALSSVLRGDPFDYAVVTVQYGFTLILLPILFGTRSSHEIEQLLKVLVLSMVFVMIYGAYVVHYVDNPHWRLVSWNGRLRSLVERENECAMLGAIAIVLILGLYSRRSIGASWLFLILPLAYGILLTGSNTGFLLLFLGGLLVTILGPSGRLTVTVFVIVGLSFALYVFLGDLLLPDIFQRRVLSAFQQNNTALAGTLLDRIYLLEEAVRLSEDTLLIGLGANQYRIVSAYGAHVHNAYLLALTEAGLLGLIGLVGLLLAALHAAILTLLCRSKKGVFGICLTIICIYILALNLFPTFYARFFLMPLILIISYAAVSVSEHLDTSEEVK